MKGLYQRLTARQVSPQRESNLTESATEWHSNKTRARVALRGNMSAKSPFYSTLVSTNKKLLTLSYSSILSIGLFCHIDEILNLDVISMAMKETDEQKRNKRRKKIPL